MINLFVRYFIIIIIFVTAFISCRDVKDNDIDKDSLSKEIYNAQLTNFTGFYFVGSYRSRPAIYRYDYGTDKYKVFWHSDEERVINLLISPNYNAGYFITKRKQRLKSSQPAIEKGKLYRIDFDMNKVESITHLEDGIQLTPFWIDNDRFTLVINSIDKTIASYINKNTQVYNRYGKLLSDNTEIYDLTKDGYPITRLPSIKMKSPNEMFVVIEKKDSIFIRQQKSQKEIYTGISQKKIFQVAWAENNKQVIMFMKSNGKEKKLPAFIDKSLIAIYDLQKKKTVKIFETVDNCHFVLIGDYLIFDNGIDNNS